MQTEFESVVEELNKLEIEEQELKKKIPSPLKSKKR
jgi:hypothetical protein